MNLMEGEEAPAKMEAEAMAEEIPVPEDDAESILR